MPLQVGHVYLMLILFFGQISYAYPILLRNKNSTHSGWWSLKPSRISNWVCSTKSLMVWWTLKWILRMETKLYSCCVYYLDPWALQGYHTLGQCWQNHLRGSPNNFEN